MTDCERKISLGAMLVLTELTYKSMNLHHFQVNGMDINLILPVKDMKSG